MTDFVNDNVYKPLKKSEVYKSDQDNFTDNIITNSFSWTSVEVPLFSYENSNPVSVFDVAEYILRNLGELTTMKLHKLLYYCQAWSLVWDEKPLFNEEIEAWANGPVVKDFFSYHRGQYSISHVGIGNSNLLTETQKETINSVLEYYGNRSAQWLIELSHMEKPWLEARKYLHQNERGNSVITFEAMSDYYSSL